MNDLHTLPTNTNVKFDLLITKPNSLNKAIALGFDQITGSAYEGVVEVDENGIIIDHFEYITIPYHFDITEKPHAQFRADFVTKVRQELETYKETA